jgi:hypothetical protein
MDHLRYVIFDESETIVSNIIVAESVEQAEEITGCKALAVYGNEKISIGDTYNGARFFNQAKEEYESLELAAKEAIALKESNTEEE